MCQAQAAYARRAGAGRGSKSGGVRLIYYYWAAANQVYLLFLYAKNEQSDMNNADRVAARKFVEVMKNAKEKDRE